MHRWAALLLVVALLLGAAGARASGTPTTTTAAAVAAQGLSAERQAALQTVLDGTVALRGLSLLAEVPIAVMTREEVRTRFAELEVAESARTGLAVSAKLYQVLGLLDPDADLVRANRELAGELTSGFYDYRSKQLVVVASEAELSPRELRTAAHEYTHALQDQHFGIQRLLDEAGNSDARRAVRALLEGDAILTSALYTRSTLSPAEREELNRPPQAEAAAGLALLDRMPLVLRENLIFPYEHGPAFVMASILPALLQRQAIDTVLNQLLAEPPQSSAEILHPDRYLEGRKPIPVVIGDAAAALGGDWRELDRGVLGALTHRIMVRQFLDAEQASRATEGWAGGSNVLLENPRGEQALLVRTRWDDAAGAQEWVDAYGAALEARYGATLRLVEERPGGRLWLTADGAVLLGGNGADTLLAFAPTPGEAAGWPARPPVHLSSHWCRPV